MVYCSVWGIASLLGDCSPNVAPDLPGAAGAAVANDQEHEHTPKHLNAEFAGIMYKGVATSADGAEIYHSERAVTEGSFFCQVWVCKHSDLQR